MTNGEYLELLNEKAWQALRDCPMDEIGFGKPRFDHWFRSIFDFTAFAFFIAKKGLSLDDEYDPNL